jgi:hypothetical protein
VILDEGVEFFRSRPERLEPIAASCALICGFYRIARVSALTTARAVAALVLPVK